jgi:hypothetical protein
MGRIRRIGTDTVTNYSFLATSAYDSTDPAATTSAWPDDAVMDQLFSQPGPTEVEEQGVLITFERLPYAFNGAYVKLKPTYNASVGEDPFIELWTHNSQTSIWTRRHRIELSNPFVGIESETRKVMDLSFFPFVTDVDKVWITMDPGSVGSPTLAFSGLQLFGQCRQTITTPNPGGTLEDDPCLENPFGFDKEGNPCLTPGADCSQFPEGCAPNQGPPLDVCNPTSVDTYKQFLAGIGDGGVALLEFNAWLDANADIIALACADLGPDPVPPPVPPLPPLPKLDLCDQDSIAAYRTAIGDPTLQAEFDSFIEALTNEGFFDVNCPTPPPDEPPVYVDPVTQEPAPDPDLPPGEDPNFPQNNVPPATNDTTDPAFNTPDPQTGAVPTTPTVTEHIIFVFSSSAAKSTFEANLGDYDAEIQNVYPRRGQTFIQTLPTATASLPNSNPSLKLFKHLLTFKNLPTQSLVAVRVEHLDIFLVDAGGASDVTTDNFNSYDGGTHKALEEGTFGIQSPLAGSGLAFRVVLNTSDTTKAMSEFFTMTPNSRSGPWGGVNNGPSAFNNREGLMYRIWIYPSLFSQTTPSITVSDAGEVPFPS